MKRSLLIITWSILMLHKLPAQLKHGVENYNVINPGNGYAWVPVIHYKGNNNFYAEARYNYEDLNTVSLYGGRCFTGGKNISYSITPMTGLVFGKFNGVSFATNATADYRRLNFSGQVQYTVNSKEKKESFFYNWSEISYQVFEKIYSGISIQQTMQVNTKMKTEKGLLIGYCSGKITIPVYIFSPFKNRSIITGLIFEWN